MLKCAKHHIKREKILNQLNKLKCSIVLIEETHLSEEGNEQLKRDWVNQMLYASSAKTREVNKSAPFVLENIIKVAEGILGTIGMLWAMTIVRAKG